MENSNAKRINRTWIVEHNRIIDAILTLAQKGFKHWKIRGNKSENFELFSEKNVPNFSKEVIV